MSAPKSLSLPGFTEGVATYSESVRGAIAGGQWRAYSRLVHPTVRIRWAYMLSRYERSLEIV